MLLDNHRQWIAFLVICINQQGRPCQHSYSARCLLIFFLWSSPITREKGTHILILSFDVLASNRFESGNATADQLREQLLEKLIEQKLLGPTKGISEITQAPSTLPVRYMPPGNLSSLYLMYIAFIRSGDGKPACRATFYEVAKLWSTCLRFRPRSEHSLCVVCSSLKQAIASASAA